MSVHRHLYGPTVAVGMLRCANARRGCDRPEIPDPEFGRPAPAVQGSPTSQEAAAAQNATKAHNDRLLVYQTLLEAPDGLTDEQIAERSGLLANTARPRRVELVAAGSVVAARNADGSPRKNRVKSGARAQVWLIAF